jgi:LytR cell envelope-related transcriptional attenuator
MRGWVVRLWAVLTTIVLIGIGIFGTLLASGRIELAPDPEPVVVPEQTVEAVVDTSYEVVILNATPEDGLATQMKDVVVEAGWPVDSVLASEAGSNDFPETTVYYLNPEDEAAAAGLAGVIGGAKVAQSDTYQPANPESRQLTVVIGLDRSAVAPTPTPSS